MTEKRFTHKKWYDERQLFDGEEAFAIVDSGTQASIICNKLNKLHEEVMNLRAENTKFKLVVKDIVRDLEQQAETREPIVISKAYAKWIKDNVNLRLNGDVE